MDNVTHTLAGLLVGEAAVQLRRARGGAARGAGRPASPGFPLAAALAGAVAANLPDADLLYTSLTPGKLTYLLHHRGHTHTVVIAVLGAVLTWAAAFALWRWRARRGRAAAPGAGDGRWLLGLVAVAVLSHLALDWTNSYGVHPFWPADNAWRYGDVMFIVEPWLWVAAVPPLFFAARRRAARAGLGLVLAAGLALAWAVSLVPAGAALALTVGVAASMWAARRTAPGARVAAGLLTWLAVELAFATGTGAARRQVVAAARASDPAARLADVVITPGPANPLCASAIVVEAAGPGGGVYRVTTASAAAAPALLPAVRCRGDVSGAGSLAVASSPRPSTAAVRWGDVWEAPRAELAALARGNCQVAALLRFARVPFWVPAGADSLYVGDLRYARGPALGFAELRVPVRPAQCPANVPPWHPPRADLLTPE